MQKINKFFKAEKDNIIIFALGILLTFISVTAYLFYYKNGLGLNYNDARSHLDIGRRVVEGLKPGLAQIGSVWLPLPHILMVFTIWNDFMWHSGLAGALISMVSFVGTGLVIYKILHKLKVGIIGKLIGVGIFTANLNILYLQSTAMTELLLIFTMTIAAYELLVWYENDNILSLVKSGTWVMLATLVRYDGWFLFLWTAGLVAIKSFFYKNGLRKNFLKKLPEAEGKTIAFVTLAGFGIVLWLIWNLLIFKDPFYFAFGPYSAKAQQDQLEAAGVLQTKHNLVNSIKFYSYALAFNSNTYILILGVIGLVSFYFSDKEIVTTKIVISALLAPLIFNIIALYLGHSVLFIQGLSGTSWFNVRYGIMLMPTIAIFVGYLLDKAVKIRYVLIGSILLVLIFSFISYDAVTIDDARVGSSQKNVTEVSEWLKNNAKDKNGFVLISAASHDAIIFSSGLPMKKFIHEGTGLYWQSALALPERWARWIIVRTYDTNDSVWNGIQNLEIDEKYNLVGHFPFADIYELKDEFLTQLNTEASLGKQK